MLSSEAAIAFDDTPGVRYHQLKRVSQQVTDTGAYLGYSRVVDALSAVQLGRSIRPFDPLQMDHEILQ